MSGHGALSRRALLASGGALALGACTGRTAGGVTTVCPPGHPAGGALDALERDLPAMMRVAGVPGIAVGLVQSDRMTSRGYGLTRSRDGSPVNGDTVFEAGSLGKPVFAYLVLGLAAEQVLSLDRPLAEYVPVPTTDAGSRKITARHVLSHTSGWRNWRNVPSQTLTADPNPGSRFAYSGEGFYHLSRVVERVTGQGILRLTRERVFRPLGMHRSSYLWSPQLAVNRADAHNAGVPSTTFHSTFGPLFRDAAAVARTSMDDWRHEDAERLLPAVNEGAPVLPNLLLPNVAGSLLTTASDYAAFLANLLRSSPLLARMLAPRVTINDAIGWGLGVGLQSAGGRSQLWHWGESSGFKSFMVADPSDGSGVVVFANGHGGRAIYERVVRAVRGDQPAFLWL